MILSFVQEKQPMTMIATAMRAARESGIALCIKCLIAKKYSNAISDVKDSEKFHRSPPSAVLAAAIITINENNASK